MRRFYLENEIGIKFYFTYHNQTVLSDISGLGFNNAFTYLKYDDFYSTIGNTFQIQEVTGIITFLNGYAGYQIGRAHV